MGATGPAGAAGPSGPAGPNPIVATDGGLVGTGVASDPLRLGPEFAYQPGNRLIFAQDAEIQLVENALAFVPMNESSAVRGGSVRVGFEAMIQSGPDYWAWQITVDGAQVATGSFQVGLHSSNTSSVHQYRRYEVDIGSVAPGSRIGVKLKASDANGNGFGTGVDQFLYMKRFRLYASVPTQEGGVYHTALWRGAVGNAATIVANNAGVATWTALEDGNPDVFEVLTAAPGPGIRFKKAGHVRWNFDQDLIVSGGSYALIKATVTNDTPYLTLMAPSGTYWDGIHNSGVAQVAPGDVLQIEFGCSGCDITALDSPSWSNLTITWNGWLDP